ncbi:MAG: hypothetical protein ABI451_06880 [Dokdonella sp.]
MKRLITMLALMTTLTGCANAESTPKALAASLQKALSAGDFAAAAALADIAGAPADLQFFYFDTVRDCAVDSDCTVKVAPLDQEYSDQLKDQAKQFGAEPPSAEGIIAVTLRAKDGSSSGDLKMPYAKVGASYKLVSLRMSPAELAARRAKSGDDLLKEMFAGGIYDNATQARRTDWATAATKLPADGGEAGKALVQQTKAMAAAVDAHDPDAAMRSGGQMAKIIFADKSYDGKPIALESRKKKLHVQSLRMLRDVKVLGGYQLGDDVALVIEARDGIGWIERGAVLVSQEGDSWDISGKQLISYPE